MLILVKIVKIGHLQIPLRIAGSHNAFRFFRLKHTCIIAEQKKLHMEGFCRGIGSDHGKMVTKFAVTGWA